MKIAYLRFMLYCARMGLALADLGGNRAAIRFYRSEVLAYEDALAHERLIQYLGETL